MIGAGRIRRIENATKQDIKGGIYRENIMNFEMGESNAVYIRIHVD